jgi:FHS family Na+ dependent glucose MFS transporter 1
MGFVFTSRGIGYLVGILLSAYILSFKDKFISKELLAALSQIICGLTLFFVDKTSWFPLCIFLYVVQGTFFGIINTVTNCLLPEIWGKRAQPWMQAMHSCFGIGAIIGPALVGYFGYQLDFFLLSVTSFVPCVMILLYRTLGMGHSNHEHDHSSSKESKNEDANKGRDAPLSFKLIVSAFFLFYVGAEAGYAGWISSYALLEEITDNESKAAYLSSIFWAALTFGRLVAIPAAIFLSSFQLIVIQLVLSVIAGVLCLTILPVSYTFACFVSGFSGFALSAMFPVMITIFGDYGYRVDANSTTMFMIGATLGEAMIPVCIGELMSYYHPVMMPVSVAVCVILLLILYGSFHYLSLRERSSYSELHTFIKDTYNPVFTHEIDDDNELDDYNEPESNAIEMVPMEIISKK